MDESARPLDQTRSMDSPREFACILSAWHCAPCVYSPRVLSCSTLSHVTSTRDSRDARRKKRSYGLRTGSSGIRFSPFFLLPFIEFGSDPLTFVTLAMLQVGRDRKAGSRPHGQCRKELLVRVQLSCAIASPASFLLFLTLMTAAGSQRLLCQSTHSLLSDRQVGNFKNFVNLHALARRNSTMRRKPATSTTPSFTACITPAPPLNSSAITPPTTGEGSQHLRSLLK
jgi:hypothetical protein